MRFLLMALTIFLPIQEKEEELVTSFEVRVETSMMGITNVVEITPHRIVRVKNSWRAENNLPIMASLDLGETEYLHELITSEEFEQIESLSVYECVDPDMVKGFPRLPSINLYVTTEEAGDKVSKSFTFNCFCSGHLVTDAPEVLCNILGDVRRLSTEHLQH